MKTLWLNASEWLQRARTLHADGLLLQDLCGVDRLRLKDVAGGARYEIVVQLLDRSSKTRSTVHVAAQGDPPTVPSIVHIWPAANVMEREAFDMFGIHFEGHPNLTRILMPDEWEGHPLRKDYGVGKGSIEFVPQPLLQVQSPGQAPNMREAGSQVDELGQPCGTAERGVADGPGA